MEKFSDVIVRFRWAVIALVALITLFFGIELGRISIDSDVLNSLPDDDPVALLYKEVGNKYRSMAVAMVVVESDSLFSNETFGHIRQITDSIRYTEGVASVSSLTDIIDIKRVDDGIEVGKLVDEYNLPETRQEFEALKRYIFSKELYRGTIISDDTTATIIVATFDYDVDKQHLAEVIQEKVKALNIPEKLYFGGLPMMMSDLSISMRSDLKRLLPIVFCLIALTLLLSFRSLRGVLLPLLTALIAVVWTLGSMVLSGYRLTIISNNIPIILLAVGSAYTIHVINRIDRTSGVSPRRAIVVALGYVTIPVLLAALTTAIGFLSFVFGAYLTTIRDFGIFSSVGTLYAVMLSLTFVPALIAVFSSDKERKSTGKPYRSEAKRGDFLARFFLKPLTRLVLRYPKAILVSWLVLLLLSVSGIFLIHASVNMQEYFKPNHPSRISEEVLQQKFGGSQPVFVRFSGDVLSPELLRKMIAAKRFLERNPFISTTLSVADLIEEMNDAMGEGRKIPDSRAKIEQLWFLLEGQDELQQLVSDELDEGIIQTKFSSLESDDMARFLDNMECYVDIFDSDSCKIDVTGLPSVYVRMLSTLISSQFTSLALAIVMVLIIVGVILKSFRDGLLAVIPIIAAVLLLFGFMGIVGITLNIATVLVASVALGIGIDYSIHVITHVSHLLKREKTSIYDAVIQTLSVSGRAITINVISVAAGFLVLLCSEMVPLQNFGLLVALSMVVSGLGALTLLPAVLVLVYRSS